jgi:hypothetical protein
VPAARPGRSPGRPTRRALAAVPALAVLAALLAAPAAAQTPAPGPDDDPVRVEVSSLAPRALAPADGVLQVGGRLVNTADAPVTDLEVRLAVGGRLRSRSALALADDRPPPTVPRGPRTVPALPRLSPGSTTPFDVRVPVADLRLGALGVYPVEVQVRGREGGGRVRVLSSARTFVPWFPEDPPAANRVAFLWPLVDVPVRAPDGAVLDDRVAEALDPGEDDDGPGRLAALLAAARTGAAGACDPSPGSLAGAAPTSAPGMPCRRDPVPLTVGVDPELLETVDALATGALSAQGDGARRPLPPDPDAAAWLDGLRELAAGVAADQGPAAPPAEVLALPLADPDVVALTRPRSGLAGDLEALRQLGRRSAADLLAVRTLEQVAWPPEGPLTSSALEAVLSGASAVVLSESALPPRRPELARTPGARTDLSTATAGRVTGLVVDEGLSALLTASPDDADWQGARLAEQRFVAETAILAAERPGESRTFVVAPARRGTVVPEVAAAALQDAGRLPWLCPVALSAVVAGTERCPGGGEATSAPVSEDRGDLSGASPDAADDELPAAVLAQVAGARALGTQLTDEVLVAGSDGAAQVRARFLRARGRAVSAAWRTRPAAADRLADRLADDVASYRGQVTLLAAPRYVLSSRTGPLDVSVSNALDQPVTVGVQVSDAVEARLTSLDTGVRTVGPSEVVPVRLRVEARTSGQFVARAVLVDRAGQPFGQPTELLVRSTGVGRLALAVTGVGVAVLLVAVGVRILRRALRRDAPLDPEEVG